MPAIPSAIVRLMQLVLLLATVLEDDMGRAAAAVTPEPYLEQASYRELRLSPSGKYLGALVPAGGRVRLAVVDVETKALSIADALQCDDVDCDCYGHVAKFLVRELGAD